MRHRQPDQAMANVHDVAAYILGRCGPMTAMKLQKLVYYSQAWSLVWDERPLFPESIEAWANGPVVPALYDRHRGAFKLNAWPIGGVVIDTLRSHASAMMRSKGSCQAWNARSKVPLWIGSSQRPLRSICACRVCSGCMCTWGQSTL